MSNFQNLVVTSTQSTPANLTGCFYQVVQNPGISGKNVLQLIPVSNTQNNPAPAVSSPVMTNTPLLNVQQPVRLSLPSGVSNVALPCPVNAQLVQQIGSANYLITTQNNPADASKTIRVDNKLSPVILRKPQGKLPSGSQVGAPSFIIMNAKPGSVPMKTIPLFPAGHGLQIPPHAEVKTVPASSLPFSIQQKILPQSTSNDTTKMPSLIYVSPMNTVKTPPASSNPSHSTVTATTRPSPVSSILVPAVQSSTMSPPKGPLKWVVQENPESNACIVPVKSTSETASKILTLMSEPKTEYLNCPSSTSSNVTKFKDNSLVMCNNKIYFLTKNGADLKSQIHIKQEAPDRTPLFVEQGTDLANKVVEVVLSKNSLSSSNAKQTSDSGSSPLIPQDAATAKPKTCEPPQVRKIIPEVIYIDDDDDDEDTVQLPKAPLHHQPTQTSSTKVHTPMASLGPRNTDNQVKDKEIEMPKTKTSPVPRVIDDRTLRVKFGLLKQEKIILNRIPLHRHDGKSDFREPMKNMMTESQEKRKSSFSETSHIEMSHMGKRMKNDETIHPSGGYYKPSSATLNAPPRWSDTRDMTSGQWACTSASSNVTRTNTDYRTANASQSEHTSVPEMFTDPSDSYSFYNSQDISGHFSEAPLPRQRFLMESSTYPDETTKDEKIQRLKEVLKEREQALEALRRQKWS